MCYVNFAIYNLLFNRLGQNSGVAPLGTVPFQTARL